MSLKNSFTYETETMKLYQMMKYIFSCVVLLSFSSCVKYHKIAKTEFPQGEEEKDHREVSYNFLRTSRIYDEFKTEAIFHTMWLSDQVRTQYNDDYCARRGKDIESKDALLKRQLEENRHWISFYVQADIRDRQHVALNDKNSLWTMYLETADNKRVEPINIKIIEMEPEYQRYFGYRYSPFKETYLVRFPMKSLEGNSYLTEGKAFKLAICSPEKKTEVEWDSNKSKSHAELLKDEDFYWG